jgi:hypothetical protein
MIRVDGTPSKDTGRPSRLILAIFRHSLGFAVSVVEFNLLSAILARSGRDAAFIFRMTWLRWTFTVISLMPTYTTRSTSLSRSPHCRASSGGPYRDFTSLAL